MSCAGWFVIISTFRSAFQTCTEPTGSSLGCASSVKKANAPIPGVHSIDIDLEMQTIIAVGKDGVPLNTILQAIIAAGKEVKARRLLTRQSRP